MNSTEYKRRETPLQPGAGPEPVTCPAVGPRKGETGPLQGKGLRDERSSSVSALSTSGNTAESHCELLACYYSSFNMVAGQPDRDYHRKKPDRDTT